jgi:hypothetical protein
MRKITKGLDADEITYFYLISRTEKGCSQSEADKKRGANDVTKAVQKAGGQCRLYSTRGSEADYISVITGIGPAAAIRLVEAIESTGAVQATLVSGLEMFGA